jgi:pimeloyl-ACP methyl ester carboxylesterase
MLRDIPTEHLSPDVPNPRHITMPSRQSDTVVLVHGMGRGPVEMRLLASRIARAGFEILRVRYQPFGPTTEQVVASVAKQIEARCCNLPGRIHFVGHSLGGLIIRAHLAANRPDVLGRVVLIATPNAGTPFVDKYRNRWWMGLAGPIARTLGTDAASFPNTLPTPNYPVGIIAGVKPSSITKQHQTSDIDDGIVPLASAKLSGMSDFITLKSTHAALRYRRDVARQTIAFLREGAFDRTQSVSR